MEFTKSEEVSQLLEKYPPKISVRLKELRSLIIETAEESEEVDKLLETTKWGEPSYLAPKGSTIRMDWKPRSPNQYAVYFTCSTKLISTFRDVFGPLFTFEGNRAIVFGLEDEIPVEPLKRCLKTALMYQAVKHLPHLGL